MSEQIADSPLAVRRVLPLYLVVFAGFVGYSLMIAIFTPLMLRPDGGMLPRSDGTSTRTIALGILLALYPLAQFLGAPIIGALSDRHGRRPTLLVSLAACAACYALIAVAVGTRTFGLLLLACFLAGLSEANISVAQSAIADIAPASERSRCPENPSSSPGWRSRSSLPMPEWSGGWPSGGPRVRCSPGPRSSSAWRWRRS